jgi:hypothetical protein
MKAKVQTRIDIDALQDIAGIGDLPAAKFIIVTGWLKLFGFCKTALLRRVVGPKPSKFSAIAVIYNSQVF